MNKSEIIRKITKSMYLNEPCRICGAMVEAKDFDNVVFAGYSADLKSRSAHGFCWKENRPKKDWAYPIDEN